MVFIIKVGVFLGCRVAYNIDAWKRQYKDHKVNDTAPYGYNRAQDENVNIEYIKFNSFEKRILFNRYLQYAYLYFIKLPALLFKYDVLWTHYDKDGLFIAKLRGIPLLWRFMAKQIANFVWLVDSSKDYECKKIRSISRQLNRIDKIVYHSYSETQKFIEVFKVDNERLQQVHFGINFDAYSDEKPMLKPGVLDEGLKDYILSVGTDVHRDIELLDELAYEMQDKYFILCSCNKEYLNRKYKSSNLKIINANLLEMRYLYKNCSVVVIPLKYNEHVSGCTTLLEAAAMKKPVIISNVPGIDDYVLDNKTGAVVPIGDIKQLKAAVLKIACNRGFAETLGWNAYNYTKDRFNTDKWSQKHVEMSKEILSEKLIKEEKR